MAFDYLPRELQRERERPRPLLTEEQVARILEALRRRAMWDEEDDAAIDIEQILQEQAGAGQPADVAVAEEREG